MYVLFVCLLFVLSNLFYNFAVGIYFLYKNFRLMKLILMEIKRECMALLEKLEAYEKQDGLLSLVECSAILGKSYHAVYRLVQTGELKAIKKAKTKYGAYVVKDEDLQKFINSKKKNGKKI